MALLVLGHSQISADKKSSSEKITDQNKYLVDQKIDVLKSIN